MAEEAETPEGDEPLIIEAEGDLEGDLGDQDGSGDAEDEIEVKFGDEAAPASSGERESEAFIKLRAAHREQAKRLAAYERGEVAKPVEVGPEPTMDECYEAEDPGEEFKTRWKAWTERKAKAEAADAETRKAREATQTAFAAKLADFGRNKTALGARDFDALEEEVTSALSQAQQAVIVTGANNAANVIYALGKHPAKLATLAAITNPIEFAFAVAKLEGTLQVTSKRRAPEPEETVRGSAPLSGGADKKIRERLEAEAERTGDRSKIFAYNKAQRMKAAH